MARHLSDAEHERIRELADQGLTVREIADRMERSLGAVHRSLHPEKAGAYRDVSREQRQNLRPRMESAERRLGVVEDQLAGLADFLGVSDADLAKATERARKRRAVSAPAVDEALRRRRLEEAEKAAKVTPPAASPKRRRRAGS